MSNAPIEGNCNPLSVFLRRSVMTKQIKKESKRCECVVCDYQACLVRQLLLSAARNTRLSSNISTQNEIKKKKTAKSAPNVRAVLQKGNLDIIKQEMERVQITILGNSEVRLQSAGKITSETIEIFYVGGAENERGVACNRPRYGRNSQRISEIGALFLEFAGNPS